MVDKSLKTKKAQFAPIFNLLIILYNLLLYYILYYLLLYFIYTKIRFFFHKVKLSQLFFYIILYIIDFQLFNYPDVLPFLLISS